MLTRQAQPENACNGLVFAELGCKKTGKGHFVCHEQGVIYVGTMWVQGSQKSRLCHAFCSICVSQKEYVPKVINVTCYDGKKVRCSSLF